MDISIYQKHLKYSISSTVFNGGEVNVYVPVTFLDFKNPMTIVANLKTSNDIMGLLLVVDALRAEDPKVRLSARIPYVPYGRQDRVCNRGEALSIRVMANLINSCGFESVKVDDPHSDVTPALIDNVVIRDQLEICKTAIPMVRGALGSKNQDGSSSPLVLVSPDAGSNKKITSVCKYFNMPYFIRADKTRNLQTGEITNTVVYASNLTGKTCVIVDDLCDGGRTFIELAKELKAKGASKIALIVSHGIFSKGKEPLEEYIDYIYAYNDWTK